MLCLPLWVSTSLGDVASGGWEGAMGRAEAVQVCFGFSGAELEDIQILC